MSDPRTTFYVPDDRQVIVYFEWEAPLGTHHCEGTLRGPNGQLAVMSSFDYPATQTRFGGFWKIPLLEDTTAGVWTFDARVDGESAGNLSFEIVSAAKPQGLGREEPLPSPAEIYTRATAATALVEKLDAKGQTFDTGSGFVLDGLFVTSFRSIDAARSLRLTFSDGRRLLSGDIAAQNRRQDWAILRIDLGKLDGLKRGDHKSVSIGDHCYWLDAKPDGGRVISDGQIVGKESHDAWGERLSVSGLFTSAAAGGPVLNDRGEVIGLLGGALPYSFLRTLRYGAGGGVITTTGSVVPIALINPTAEAKPTTLQGLWDAGQFSPPVTAASRVSYGMIVGGQPAKGKPLLGKEMKTVFTPQDQTATIIVAFQGIEPWKDTVQLRIYDADNHLLSNGAPVKMNLGRGRTEERAWSFPLNAMHPGIYKADAVIGDEVAWRDYFRVRD